WRRIDSMLRQAMTRPRDPDQTAVQALRAEMAADLLTNEGWPEYERVRLRDDRLDALRRLSRLDPTNATIRARLALALADSGHDAEAANQAERALELDRITPHRDRKLPDALRNAIRRAQEDGKARSGTPKTSNLKP
ncbi:MAG TPA: hypothetical protein VFT74_12695, partial [Isosphaeraceae bacterium]|nr:hypothetical protein [Isosphaeraceae bacterium]